MRFEIAGTLSIPRPGPLGRGLRLAKGVGLSAWLLSLPFWRFRFGEILGLGRPTTWLLVLLLILLLPLQTRMTLGLRWKPWAQRVGVLAALAGLGAVDLVRSDTVWGPVGSAALYWSAVTALLITASSLILAALVAAPG